MQTHFCSSCGAEFETDEAEKWKGRLCGICADVEKRERMILDEWEREQDAD